jgi:GMP synthase-like glutamine amidotransferase
MTAMRAHYLQHVPFEGLGSIAAWLDAAGYTTTGAHLYRSATLPRPDDFDLLIIMGGPMSVHDEADFPWLAAEKQLIRQAIAARRAVLGVCLGAQLIAAALAAPVYRHRFKEIGWFPIFGAGPEDGSAFRFPAATEVFHWHGDTFDLPPGAIRLAGSEGCENQAFQLGDRVIGLQFHLETTPEAVRAMIAHGRAELAPARFVQPETSILAAPPEQYRAINRLMADVLAYLDAAGRRPPQPRTSPPSPSATATPQALNSLP